MEKDEAVAVIVSFAISIAIYIIIAVKEYEKETRAIIFLASTILLLSSAVIAHRLYRQKRREK